MTPKERIGQRIYELRVRVRGRSQAQFGREVAKAEGRAIAYTANTVSDWERGTAYPRTGAVAAIMKVTGTKWEALVEGAE